MFNAFAMVHRGQKESEQLAAEQKVDGMLKRHDCK